MILSFAVAFAANVEVVVEQTINVPLDRVMATVTDFETWKEWTAWNMVRYPERVWTYEGEVGAVGHAVTWEGKGCDQGATEITEITESSFGYDLRFGKSDKNWPSVVSVSETEGVSTVSWEMQGSMGFPMSLFSGMISKSITLDYQVGLAGLKARLESAAVQDAVEEAAEAVDDAVDGAVEAVEDAVDDAAEAVEDTAEEVDESGEADDSEESADVPDE